MKAPIAQSGASPGKEKDCAIGGIFLKKTPIW
jgi:hypothetical protein